MAQHGLFRSASSPPKAGCCGAAKLAERASMVAAFDGSLDPALDDDL